MANYEFKLPDVGEGVTEAEIAAWYVKVGDHVEEDSPLVDIASDKAIADITSPVTGTVLALHGLVGDRLAVGSVLVEFQIEDQPASLAVSPRAEVGEVAPVASPEPIAQASSSASTPVAQRLPALAAPATRARAKQLGISLTDVAGTGPDGRVLPQDLDRLAAKPAAPPRPARDDKTPSGVTDIRIIGVRRMIAEKMQESKRRIPHFTHVEEFDLTELEAMRRKLNENATAGLPKLTLLPFFMRALVLVAPAFPHVNARYDDEAGILRQYRCIHIGIATQTPTGLMVPVVRDAQSLSLWDSARELMRVTLAARAGKAKREELTGSTITLTSLGALGGIAATPIINHPEVAIIGPNKLVERPVVHEGRIVVRRMMHLSASFDHRIVDGHDAARFVQQLKQLVEQPSLLFIQMP